MKLNLDFSLYKGTTRLRHWWKAVKANFEAVQNAHNDLEDKYAADMETLKDANADLKQRIENEAEARAEADNALGGRISTEAAAREAADSELKGKIADEIAAREELDERFKPVEKMAHVHENKDILDGIDADRVRKWDDGAEGQITLGEYLEHLAEAERQFDAIWDLFGMTVYDGGWFGMAQFDVLDGGDFDDTVFTPLDCGDFGKFVPAGGGVGDVVDGGTY